MAKEQQIVSVRIAKSSLEKLRILAQVENKNGGELIRTAIDEFIERRVSDPVTQKALQDFKRNFDLEMETVLNLKDRSAK